MVFNEWKGQLLLATPDIQEPQFKDSVVLLCHHDESGSMGLIINRPQNISIFDIMEDIQLTPQEHAQHNIPEQQTHSYEGGPLDPFRGFVLHDGWHIYESTMQVTREIHLTTSKDVLEDVVQKGEPEHFMLILGYSGWSAGQLEHEMMENRWLLAPATPQILFHTTPELRWHTAAQILGVDRAHLSLQIGHA